MLDTAPNVGPGFKHRRLGHFRREAAYEHYLLAYDRALAQLPPPS